MKTVGIICEYNPMHYGHVRHVEETRAMLGEECAVVCVMSGNFVQRGDLGVFSKHARAAAAAACGADLVVELPLTAVLSSAEGFARGGVQLLDALGICTHISFGSEAGETESLSELAGFLRTPDCAGLVAQELKTGIAYAAARQNAVGRVLGRKAEALRSPNNILAVEYLKALQEFQSVMQPLTIRRIGAAHDSEGAESASQLRRMLKAGEEPWHLMPEAASVIYAREIALGRGPVFMENAEAAVLSRLRCLRAEDFARLPDASEGLDQRLMRYAKTEPTLAAVLESAKTKRYPMSRLRRMVLAAVLGVTASDLLLPPQYIRVLAMNQKGKSVLREIKKKALLPVITKPAHVRTLLTGQAFALFEKESDATDFYVLAYPAPDCRTGGQEWTISPSVL